MRKTARVFFIAFLFAALLMQFPLPVAGNDSGTASGYWKLTSKEVLWVEPFLAEKWTYPEDIPWDKPFSAVVNGGEISTVYTGAEFEVTRSDHCKNWPVPDPSITFKWSAPPETIRPGEDYSFTYETVGNGGNGIVISSLFDPSAAAWGWCPISVLNGGPQTFTYKAPDAPKAATAKDLKCIRVQLSSGAIGTGCLNFAGYNYLYEWVNEKPRIKSIAVVPGTIRFTSSAPVQLKVSALLSDGSTRDITRDPDTDYDVDDEDVVSVSSAGLAKAVPGAKNGERAVITVSSGDVEKTVPVTLSIITAKSIKSTTSSIVLSNAAGKNTKQLKITATLPNGTTSNVTSKAAYTSSNARYFTVSSGGLLKVAAAAPKGAKGSITASYGGKSCKIGITVK